MSYLWFINCFINSYVYNQIFGNLSYSTWINQCLKIYQNESTSNQLEKLKTYVSLNCWIGFEHIFVFLIIKFDNFWVLLINQSLIADLLTFFLFRLIWKLYLILLNVMVTVFITVIVYSMVLFKKRPQPWTSPHFFRFKLHPARSQCNTCIHSPWPRLVRPNPWT